MSKKSSQVVCAKNSILTDVECAVRYWVPIVNQEFGLSDKNEQAIRWFLEKKQAFSFWLDPHFYCVYLIAEDYWGEKQFSVVSLYIKPQKRKRLLLKVMRSLEKMARDNGCKKIGWGSCLNPKMNQMLERVGYQPIFFAKEV